MFHYNLSRVTGILHEYQCTVMIISRCILLRTGNASDKGCRENQNTLYV